MDVVDATGNKLHYVSWRRKNKILIMDRERQKSEAEIIFLKILYIVVMLIDDVFLIFTLLLLFDFQTF